MRGLQSRVTKGLTIGSRMLCDDNSGAKIVQIIGVKGSHSKRTRTPSVGIGDIVIVAVKKGVPQMKKKVEKAVIIRQRRSFRRAGGTRVEFEDNAAVLIDDQGLPKGTEIKGAIAREVVDRFPKVAGIASAVV
ncbi:MAG: LSU ribosomal protein L14 [Candidatus Fermentimicrarchaeum limneticum]|uniref:Large ribosomal subunit protein uL14 n=1 Tax=Fermentimicrarchaeum limneticum TaxID=2795018 RepID=A0A7D6BNY2_FERL1|nr:MAG: LSU ribosomal protein L14 [Candidatus Fermentimicrarchaeum limneticum]